MTAEGQARGWRGFRVDDSEAGDEPEVGFYCPQCAEREFGPPFTNRFADPDPS